MSNLPDVPWNKGLSYTIAKRKVYANKGAWKNAMVRMFTDRCMRCGWSEAHCDTHHIVPKREGGQRTLENGILLCPNCHRLADVGRIVRRELIRIRLGTPVIGVRV